MNEEPNKNNISQQENSAPQQMQTVGKPICCPQCGSRNLAFVGEYHKCLGLRIASYIILGFLAVLCYGHLWDFVRGVGSDTMHTFFTACFAIAFIVLQIIILVNESKTHAKAICRDCGQIWLLD